MQPGWVELWSTVNLNLLLHQTQNTYTETAKLLRQLFAFCHIPQKPSPSSTQPKGWLEKISQAPRCSRWDRIYRRQGLIYWVHAAGSLSVPPLLPKAMVLVLVIREVFLLTRHMWKKTSGAVGFWTALYSLRRKQNAICIGEIGTR